MILDGVFPPGSMLSQVKLAESPGVSRIRLREALRMLQKEGLVEAEHNQRARVPSFEPAIVDSLYASRILLEALSIRLTVPRIEQADVQRARGSGKRKKKPARVNKANTVFFKHEVGRIGEMYPQHHVTDDKEEIDVTRI